MTYKKSPPPRIRVERDPFRSHKPISEELRAPTPSAPTITSRSDWPEPDRELVLTRIRESEERLASKLSTLDSRLQALQQSELLQETRLQNLETNARLAGRHAGIAWGTAGSGIIAFVLWLLQQIQSMNGITP